MNHSTFTNKEEQSSRILYTPSDFARLNLIYLQEVGKLKVLSPHISKRADLNSFLFFIVESGKGFLIYQGERYELKEGDCVFIDCREYYSQYSDEDLWTLKWVHFYGSNLINIYNKYVERGGYLSFHPDNVEKYGRIIDSVYEIANSDDYIKDMKIYAQLTKLLTYVMEESWHPESKLLKKINRRDVQEIRLYIDENYHLKITLDSIAKKFYINKTYLTRIFKDQYGKTVTSYINEVRITKAKELLRFTDLFIEDVGLKCGIDDPNYFGRLFKRIEGMSPGNYRKQWQNEHE